MRRLIVNADDFGLTPGINRAIIQAHERGIVTSTTLMANGGAFEDAVRLALHQQLSVGCHVVLVDGAPILPRPEVASLLEDGSHYYSSLGRFVRAIYSGRIRAEEIEAESTAQIRKLQATGIRVSHVDTHKHTHMFPQVLKPLVRAAKACGVTAIRRPFEGSLVRQLWSKPNLWLRGLEVGTLRALEGNFLRSVREVGLSTTDGAVGIAATGEFDESLLTAALTGLPDGTWELVCHPGYQDSSLDRLRTRLRESREEELKLLTSTGVRQLLQNECISLLSYYDLSVSGQAPK